MSTGHKILWKSRTDPFQVEVKGYWVILLTMIQVLFCFALFLLDPQHLFSIEFSILNHGEKCPNPTYCRVETKKH